MRFSDFVKKPIVIILMIVVLLLGSMMIYSYASEGDMTFFQNAVGMVFSPARKAGTAVGNFFTDGFDRLTGYDKLSKENSELKAQLAQAQYQLRQYEPLESENAELREYLGLKAQHDDYTLAYAGVTGRGAGNFDKVLVIDAGTRDGIEQGDLVITTDGVVGVISSAGTSYAEVTTILDTDVSLGGMIVRTRDVAVLEGSTKYQNEGKCTLTLLPNENSAQAGDMVQTSGLGHKFPQGIVIGTVTEVYKDEYSSSTTAVVQPAVDYSSVTSVMIITSFGNEAEQ